MKVAGFDIETVADPKLVEQYYERPILDLPAFEPAKTGNIKDPVKIAEKQEQAQQRHQEAIAAARNKHAEAAERQFELASLDPHVARIVATGIAWRDNDSKVIHRDARCVHALNDEVERHLLKDAWAMLSNFDRIITFNGASFDLPFLYRRSLLLGITPSISIEMGKYRVTDGKSNHIDLRSVLAESNVGSAPAQFAKGNLDFYLKLLCGKSKTEGIDGSKVGEFFRGGRFDEIERYVGDDAESLFDIYDKVQGFYFI